MAKSTLLSTVFLVLFTTRFTQVNSQIVITSTNGWEATVDIVPIGVNPSPANGCPWSYNYDISYTYTVSFTGSPSNRSFSGNIYFTCSAGSGSEPYRSMGSFNSNNSGSTATNNQARTIANTSGSAFGYTYPNKKCSEFTLADANCTQARIEYWGNGVANGAQTINFNAPLPIVLAAFKVEKLTDQQVEITWKTNIEVNNEYFTVLKSHNGKDWESIAEVQGQGTNYEATSYRVLDARSTGMVYYKVVQHDFDGKTTESPILSIGGYEATKMVDVLVFPNPASDYIVPVSERVFDSYMILDRVGRELAGGQTNMNQPIDVSFLQPGLYKLVLLNQGERIGSSSIRIAAEN